MPLFTLTKERKILVAGGAVLLLLGLVYNLYPRLSSFIPREEMLQLQQDKLARYRRKISAKQDLVNLRQALERRLRSAEAGLLDAKTPALAAVEIQKRLQALAAQHGAEIKTMRQREAAAVDADAPYRAVAVEVALTAEIKQLVEMMHAIETSPKIHRITKMTLRTAGHKAVGSVTAALTVQGFMKADEG